MSTSMPAVVGFGRHFTRVGAFGRRQRRWQASPAPGFRLWAIAEVINNDGEFTGVYRCQRQRATRKQFDEIEAKLIFPTTAVD
jgi:hypothetical protein